MLKVITDVVYDKYNPERVFKRGTVLKVNDTERARRMLASAVVAEVPDSEDFVELDPVKEEPKKTTRKRKTSEE